MKSHHTVTQILNKLLKVGSCVDYKRDTASTADAISMVNLRYALSAELFMRNTQFATLNDAYVPRELCTFGYTRREFKLYGLPAGTLSLVAIILDTAMMFSPNYRETTAPTPPGTGGDDGLMIYYFKPSTCLYHVVPDWLGTSHLWISRVIKNLDMPYESALMHLFLPFAASLVDGCHAGDAYDYWEDERRKSGL